MGFRVYIVIAVWVFFADFQIAHADVAAAPAAKSLALRDSILLSFKVDHDVQKAARAVEAAGAKLSSARSQFFPSVGAEIDAGTFHDRNPIPGDTSIPLVPRDRNSYVALLTLSEPLFSGFASSSAMTRYKALETSSELDLEIAKENTIEKIISLYYGVQLYERQIAAENEIQALRENQLEQVNARFKQGAATDLQQLQALYSVKQQVPKIQALEAQLSSTRLKLYRELNLPLDQTYVLTDPLPQSIGTPVTFKLPALPEALDFALRNSLQIRKIEAQFVAIQGQGGQALAPHLPTLSLQLTAGTDAYERQDIATADSLAYGAELILKIPLFSGLDSVSDRAYWRSQLEELKEERAKLRETLLDQLNDTYRQLELTSSRIEASQVNLELTTRAVQRAQSFYRTGRATLTDVLNSYGNNLDARKQALQDTYDRIVALFHIKALLGLGATFDENS